MKKDSNPTKILKVLFMNKKPMTTKEICKATGVQMRDLQGYTRKIMGLVSKKTEYGNTTYWIPSYQMNHVKMKLHQTLGDFEDDEPMDSDTQ